MRRIPRLFTALQHGFNLVKEKGVLDPLIKLSIIHHQYESIHSFYDGNYTSYESFP